jgi:5-methylcytosine-specific restriction endonuclease McrA
MKSRRSKATDIPMSVKKKVWERDEGKCVICGNSYNVMPNAHYIRRSKGGLGIEQNIFTACTNFTPLKCHSNFDDFGIGKEAIVANFKKHYEDWSEEDLVYKK